MSVQAVTVEHGKLIRSLYDGQPFVYTGVNSNNDICIDFPVVEINCNSVLSESFLSNKDDENLSRELYGDFLAKKFLFGGRLFIDVADSDWILDILKFYLIRSYKSAKNKIIKRNQPKTKFHK